MPCTVTGTLEGDARLEAFEATREAARVTRYLCHVLGKVEDASVEIPDLWESVTTPNIQKYWHEHKESDRIGRIKEQLKKESLEKEERDELERLKAKYPE